MAEENKGIRLKKAATELNVGISTLVEFLAKKGHQVEMNPNTRLSAEQYDIVATAFQAERAVKEQADKIEITPSSSNVVVEATNDENKEESEEVIIKNYNTSPADNKVAAKPVETAVTPDEPEVSETVAENAAEPVTPIESEQVPEAVSEPAEPQPAEPEAAPAFIPTQVGDLRIINKIDLDAINTKTRPDKKKKTKAEKTEKQAKASKTPKAPKAEVQPKAPKEQVEAPKEPPAPAPVPEQTGRQSGSQPVREAKVIF